MKKILFLLWIMCFILLGNCYAEAIISVVATSNSNITVDVPVIGNVNSISNAQFNVIGQGVIEADGAITINIIYNDLVGANQVSLMAYSDDMVGQTLPIKIPLSMKIVGQTYKVLTATGVSMKDWVAPYSQAVSDTIVLKISADFSKMIKQQYKCVIAINLNKN